MCRLQFNIKCFDLQDFAFMLYHIYYNSILIESSRFKRDTNLKNQYVNNTFSICKVYNDNLKQRHVSC